MSWVRQEGADVVIQVRAVPRASRTQVGEVMGDALKIRVQAPPVEGKANAALTEFLADRLQLPERRVVLLAGDAGRNKRFRLCGVGEAAVRAALIR